jgi:hypothetical protein
MATDSTASDFDNDVKVKAPFDARRLIESWGWILKEN